MTLRPPKPLTVAQVAHRLGCTSRTVLRLIERGRLAGAFQLEAQWRVPVEAVEALRACPERPTCPPASD